MPNRSQLEENFAKRFGKLARKQQRELKRLFGDPPDFSNIPEAFWDKMQRETDAELYAILLLIFDESAIFHGWDTAASGLAAYGWAKQRAEDFSKYWVESTQTRLANGFDNLTTAEQIRETTVAEARAASGMGGIPNRGQAAIADDDEPFEPVNRILPGQPPVKIPTKEEIDDLLNQTFGENRIETNAIDETTRARHAGGEAAIEETVGLSQDDLWRNNPRDSKSGPCPICTSLNGLKRSEWPWRYREGPPSPHFRCVCDVVHANVPLSDAIGRMLDDPDYKSLSAQPRFNLKSWYRQIPNAAEWRAYCRENELNVDDLSAFKSFNPSESRDDHGRWSGSGESSTSVQSHLESAIHGGMTVKPAKTADMDETDYSAKNPKEFGSIRTKVKLSDKTDAIVRVHFEIRDNHPHVTSLDSDEIGHSREFVHHLTNAGYDEHDDHDLSDRTHLNTALERHPQKFLTPEVIQAINRSRVREMRLQLRDNRPMKTNEKLKAFNASEPRDSDGKWTSSGSPHQAKETDKYVLRRTPDPEGDLKRGWSAWAGQYTKNPLDIGDVDNKMQSAGKDVYDIINDLPEDCVHETDDGWEINETPEAMNAVAEWLRDELDLDVQKDPKSGKFALRHHEGLSSYELEAENPDDAIREGHHRVHHGNDTFLTGGRTGIGPVSYRHLGDDKYVFRVNNIGMQGDS